MTQESLRSCSPACTSAWRERFGRPRVAPAARHGDARHRADARTWHGNGGEPGDPGSGSGGPCPGLESLAVQSRPGHPGLAELLRQLIDALGKAGI